MTTSGPRIDEIREFLAHHQPLLNRTPVVRCSAIESALGGIAQVSAKLEFLQRTGTFKARGALATLFSLSADELARGVTAVSAGNHAIATAFAAQAAGTTAKVVMPKTANPGPGGGMPVLRWGNCCSSTMSTRHFRELRISRRPKGATLRSHSRVLKSPLAPDRSRSRDRRAGGRLRHARRSGWWGRPDSRGLRTPSSN